MFCEKNLMFSTVHPVNEDGGRLPLSKTEKMVPF